MGLIGLDPLLTYTGGPIFEALSYWF